MAAATTGVSGTGSHHSKALGADLAALTPERRAEYRVAEDESGVLVLDVKEGSVFEQGLRPGDIIKKVGSVPVTSPSEIDPLVQKSETKAAVLLLINRQGHDLFLALKPAAA